MEAELSQMIVERRERLDESDRNDVLELLLKANAEEKGSAKLSDQELLSNCIAIMLAGHETTSNTLAAAFTLLALWPEHQDKLHQEAVAVIGDETTSPAFENYKQFTYTLAVFMEALRMFPPATLVNKMALKDTTIPATTMPTDGSNPEVTAYPVTSGTVLRNSLIAVHYNPNCWEDPYTFRPERFLGSNNKKELACFQGFSSGIRGCVGRTFALVESVAIISQIMLRYSVEPSEELAPLYRRRPGESSRHLLERVYHPHHANTLTTTDLKLTFRKRPGF